MRKGLLLWKHPRFRRSLGVPDTDIVFDAPARVLLEKARREVGSGDAHRDSYEGARRLDVRV